MPKPPPPSGKPLERPPAAPGAAVAALQNKFLKLSKRISELEKTMGTETEKIMEYLRKMEDESQKRDQVAFRRISDLENGGLSQRVEGSDVTTMPVAAPEVEGSDVTTMPVAAPEVKEDSVRWGGTGLLDTIFQNLSETGAVELSPTAKLKNKKSKRKKKKKSKKKGKKQTKRKKR